METSNLPQWPPGVSALANQLVSSRQFQRLRYISFLGAIERFSRGSIAGTSSAGSRFEHSIGVAELVLALDERLRLSPGEKRIAIAHALLHDIGHGPFSHSTENFFSSTFGVDHHSALSEIICDDTHEIAKILKRNGILHDYRRFVSRPSSIPLVENLFFSPINVDTIEGILRSARFFGLDVAIDEERIAGALSGRNPRYDRLDQFWRLKSCVYNEYIFGPAHSVFDRVISDALFSVREEVLRSDFLLTDDLFEERYHGAIHRSLQLEQISSADRGLRRRSFKINSRLRPRGISALRDRYIQG